MNDIRTLLKSAAVRLETSAFLRALNRVAIIAAALLVLLVLIDRVPANPIINWLWVGPAFFVLAVGAAAIIWWHRRLNEQQIALAVDERLDLREKLSTALHCLRGEGRDDAFAQAAVEDAVNTARRPQARELVKRRFKVDPPHNWWISPVMILAAAALFLLPQQDLFAKEASENTVAVRDAQSEVTQTIKAIDQVIEQKPALKQELEGMADELARKTAPSDSLKNPEQLKREALKKVTELNKKLDDILSGEKGKTAKALEEQLAKLTTPKDGPAKDLAEALARGDFEQAKNAFEKMMNDLQNGAMDEEQKKQLANQMQQMAQQLDQLAQNQQALQQALQQAGLNPQLANNPQALQQAIQQAQNLNQQQKQQLQQMMQAQQAAQQMCQGLGGACQQIAQALQQGQQPGQQGGQPGQAGQQMAQQLGQMEQLQQLLQEAQAAMQQCQSQCQGLGQGLAMSQKQGPGMGQRGQGAGGVAPNTPTPYKTTLQKVDTPIGEGEIIASMVINTGQPIRGEVKSKLSEVVRNAATGFDEAQADEPVPVQYQNAMKHYFGELEQQVKAIAAESGKAPAKDPPAADSKESEPTGGSK